MGMKHRKYEDIIFRATAFHHRMDMVECDKEMGMAHVRTTGHGQWEVIPNHYFRRIPHMEKCQLSRM
jgi:hypothetical protein